MSQRITGAQRYGWELLKAIDGLLDSEYADLSPIEVFAPQKTTMVSHYKHLRIRKVGRFGGRVWEQLELPHFCRGTVLFTPCGGAPLLHRSNVVTIHDASVLAVPYGMSFWFRAWYRLLYPILGRSAFAILTVSHFSKAEISRLFKIPPEKIVVTYLGSEHVQNGEVDASILQRFGLKRQGYVLAVSSRNPYKNFSGIVAASRELARHGIQVAFAGGQDDSVYKEIEEFPDSIVRLGYVTDAELRALYKNAACFVFPSFYEGFGLPPLEALSFGCPVVVSCAGSLPEVFHRVASLCDPHNPDDIADKVIHAVASTSQVDRNEYIRFASSFSWNRCAQETLAVLRDAASHTL